jgi:rare lipoprotein A (peptidoglycan hydrolase)
MYLQLSDNTGNKIQDFTSQRKNREQDPVNKLNRSGSMVTKIKALVFALVIVLPNGVALPANAGNASATYYSDYYIGRKMANGRRFSQSAMVAAHPTYKLGTRLRVKYKGRSVTVVVSDRCNCSLDLSKAAFSQLAPLKKGRIPVRISKQ